MDNIQSQRTNLIKFFERMRGDFTAAPNKLEPVSKIPHAAPTIENPIEAATPILANAYGSIPCHYTTKTKISSTTKTSIN